MIALGGGVRARRSGTVKRGFEQVGAGPAVNASFREAAKASGRSWRDS
jgi:hypothetical protein